MNSSKLTPSTSAFRCGYTADSFYVKWCPMFQSEASDLRLFCDIDGGKVCYLEDLEDNSCFSEPDKLCAFRPNAPVVC